MISCSLDEMLALFRARLETWTRNNRALLSIAKDPWNALEMLAEAPAGLRVILNWSGDAAAGNLDGGEFGSVNNVEVIVSYNLGLTAKPDAALLSAQPNRPALLRCVSEIRECILSLGVEDEASDELVSPGYVGCEPVITPEGIPLAAFRLRFTFVAAFPDYDISVAE